ncbi:Short-chain dehydrogenase virD [Paramyrothecium foliicola]|nr:Short-chain dehydrogenase virD [Paramyrothecium foliicola]
MGHAILTLGATPGPYEVKDEIQIVERSAALVNTIIVTYVTVMSETKRFALVTGCGKGGIGEALVKEYTRQGVHAIATLLPDESSDHLDEAGISWFPLDVTDEKSILNLKQNIMDFTNGKLEVLVNNA